MGGGPSTPALASAVSAAGGLGFLAAGYKPPDAVLADLEQLRSLLSDGVPFGVNVFAPPGRGAGADQVAAYAETLSHEAATSGVALGTPRWDDDCYADKLDLLCAEHVPVVSFAFWVTMTTPDEAGTASVVGADALIVQGVEAGGHRGGFDDAEPGDVGLVQLVRARVGDQLPLVATGGVATGLAVAGVLAARATAAQLSTAFVLCPEAATAPAHRDALARREAPTALTRAFTGRMARGIVNRFLREHSTDAPSAYPEIHHLTMPVRAAARQRADADGFHLWAGLCTCRTRPCRPTRRTTRRTGSSRPRRHH